MLKASILVIANLLRNSVWRPKLLRREALGLEVTIFHQLDASSSIVERAALCRRSRSIWIVTFQFWRASLQSSSLPNTTEYLFQEHS